MIEPKKWVHFAGTYDSKSGDVLTYINGKETHNATEKGELEQNISTRKSGIMSKPAGMMDGWMSFISLPELFRSMKSNPLWLESYYPFNSRINSPLHGGG